MHKENRNAYRGLQTRLPKRLKKQLREPTKKRLKKRENSSKSLFSSLQRRAGSLRKWLQYS